MTSPNRHISFLLGPPGVGAPRENQLLVRQSLGSSVPFLPSTTVDYFRIAHLAAFPFARADHGHATKGPLPWSHTRSSQSPDVSSVPLNSNPMTSRTTAAVRLRADGNSPTLEISMGSRVPGREVQSLKHDNRQDDIAMSCVVSFNRNESTSLLRTWDCKSTDSPSG